MKAFTKYAPWINRVVLFGAALVFTAMGLRYIFDPLRTSAAAGVSLGSPLASTTARIGFGAFPLGIAIFTLACLASKRRLLTGVRLVATVIATAVAVRLFSIAADGAVPQSLQLLIPEGVILALSVAGLALEKVRLRNAAEQTA